VTSRTAETVGELRARGFGTVLAHPERHPSPDLRERLRELVGLGALIQLTAAFVADGSAEWFIAERLVHVVASDAHSSHGGRRVEIGAALRHLARDPVLGPHADWIARRAPNAIVAGDAVAAPY
jgi:tyrosine-protein phosphatase YwqE